MSVAPDLPHPPDPPHAPHPRRAQRSSRAVRVALHDYRSDPALPQKDGVNLAHENIAALLRAAADDPAEALDVHFHDLNRLLADEAAARDALADVDCVVSNVGPHAHYYFALRERLGANFRIVRDVRTAMWSSYLLQEHLAAPLLREGDVLLAGSHYTRTLYRRLFPHLATHPIHRCYPLTVGFPKVLPARTARDDGVTLLGYLGRLSEDKNLPDLIEALIRLNEAEPGRWRLLACGDVHSASCSPERLRDTLQRRLGRSDVFEHRAARPNAEVWAVLAEMDVLLFPSTSNLETLGRVLLEAAHAGLPVLSGAHAAAPELVDTSALVPVVYEHGRHYDMHFDHSLGHVPIDALVQALRERRWRVPHCLEDYRGHGARLLATLRDEHPAGDGESAPPLLPGPHELLTRLEATLPPPLDAAESLACIAQMARWFLVLQRPGTPERAEALEALRGATAFAERTERYITRSAGTRCDFTNVGGIDIELCNVVGYFPRFTLRESPGR